MKWQNWSKSVTCEPTAIRYPTTQDELIAIVKENQGKKLRVVGSGHSFTPLVATDQVMISLEHYQGIEHLDREKKQATVKAGTTIHHLSEWLFEQGMGQENLGDIDRQSIAGAISTGTHGSGATLGTIATQVIGLTLITPSSEVVECSETQQREIFKAAQVSLGALGIISQVTLQLVPAYALDYHWKKMNLTECLDNLEKFKNENRHFEFFWIPYTETVLAKFMNKTREAPLSKNLFRKFNEMVLENAVLWLLSETARFRPQTSPTICKIMANLVTAGHDIQYSHRIYATPRLVKFQEMEYNIPAEHFAAVIREMQESILKNRFETNFPTECRFVRQDDIYLSPAYGRESAYIAVHVYKDMDYKPYFEAMEAIFKKYDGRPHWGKMHARTGQELQQLYPRWQDFQEIRQRLDPARTLLNGYLEALFPQTT